jgi:hypothetical protein
MARPKPVAASSSQSVKTRTITFVSKEPQFCGSFFVCMGKNYGTRPIPANPVAGDGKLCHGFCLENIL